MLFGLNMIFKSMARTRRKIPRASDGVVLEYFAIRRFDDFIIYSLQCTFSNRLLIISKKLGSKSDQRHNLPWKQAPGRLRGSLRSRKMRKDLASM